MADQRKATDASGKGLEEEGGGRNTYKPKMPGARGSKAAASRSSVGRSGATGAEGPGTASAGGAAKKIPKWKL